MQEHPPPDQILKSHDREPTRYVRASRWSCVVCDPKEEQGAYSDVEWIGKLGRCSVCGQKQVLAEPFDTYVPGDEKPRENRRQR